MTSMSDYLENPHWEAMYRYSMGPPNNGFFAKWPPQGSPGMNHPMFLWSNEYMHTSMKHGQDNVNPYQGGITNFAPSVTPELQRQVVNCGKNTINPGGCQLAAVRKVFSTDAKPYFQKHEHPEVSRHTPALTPHPYKVSYKTGYSPQMANVPPTSH